MDDKLHGTTLSSETDMIFLTHGTEDIISRLVKQLKEFGTGLRYK